MKQACRWSPEIASLCTSRLVPDELPFPRLQLLDSFPAMIIVQPGCVVSSQAPHNRDEFVECCRARQELDAEQDARINAESAVSQLQEQLTDLRKQAEATPAPAPTPSSPPPTSSPTPSDTSAATNGSGRAPLESTAGKTVDITSESQLTPVTSEIPSKVGCHIDPAMQIAQTHR